MKPIILKSFFYGLLTLGLIGFVSSCKNNDNDYPEGKWPAMEWTIENNNADLSLDVISPGITYIHVGEAGSADIICNNYSYFWISPGNYYPEMPDTYEIYEEGWLQLEIKNNILHCRFLKECNLDVSEINVDMTAGDVFNTLVFIRDYDTEQSELDGNWDVMKWITSTPTGDILIEHYHSSQIHVFTNGEGCIDFECENYSFFWFDHGNYYPETPNSIESYKKDWISLEIQDNILHCEFSDSTNFPDKKISVTVTAGDTFFTFVFEGLM